MRHRARIQLDHDYTDYAITVYSFVTICAMKKLCRFGSIEEGEAVLSDIEKMVFQTLDGINGRYGEVKILRHVIMPNHIHFVITIPSQDRSHFYVT